MDGESVEVLVGRIDERTAAIQTDVVAVKTNINELFGKFNELRSQVDTLQAEHNERSTQGANCATGVNTTPLSLSALPKWMVAAVGGSGLMGIIALIIVIALLAHYGLL